MAPSPSLNLTLGNKYKIFGDGKDGKPQFVTIKNDIQHNCREIPDCHLLDIYINDEKEFKSRPGVKCEMPHCTQ